MAVTLTSKELIIIGIILALYILTHVVCNLEHQDAELEPLVITKPSENPHRVINYIIPGMMRLPKKALDPFADEMIGDVIFVDLNTKVWDSDHFANQIAEHAIAGGYKDVRVFAISLGDKVARKLGAEPGHKLRKTGAKLTTYDINPCANCAEVKSKTRPALTLGTPLFKVITFLLGPLGYIDFIPGDQGSKFDKNRHNLVELSSQLFAIAFEDAGKFGKESNLILSKNDGQLDNAQIVKDAEHANSIETINATHADIIGWRGNYLEALNDAGAFDDD